MRERIRALEFCRQNAIPLLFRRLQRIGCVGEFFNILPLHRSAARASARLETQSLARNNTHAPDTQRLCRTTHREHIPYIINPF